MKRLCLLLGLLTLLGGAAGAVSSKALQPGGTIVFSSNRGGDYEIYGVNPDGTGLTQFTHNRYEDSSPVPSPNGRLIAFYSDAGNSVMNADGSGLRRLPGCTASTQISWSPDSNRLVCEGPPGSGRDLIVVDVAAGTTRTLARSGDDPNWSPDGRTISYVDAERLWVVPAEGGARRRVGGHRCAGSDGASWSPDSQRLVYIGMATSKRADLFTISADGSDERRVVQGVEEIAPVSWSPGGDQIAFLKGVSGLLQVFTVHPDGTALRRVTTGKREASIDPAWSADGTQLLYLRQRYRDAPDDDIFITAPGTGEGRPLTHPFPTGGTNLEPHWALGAPLTGTEHAPPTIALPLNRQLSFEGPIGGVRTDGRRAIPGVGTSGRGSLLIWDGVSGHTKRVRTNCAPGEVALAGRSLSWTCVDRGNTYIDIGLETLRLGARRPTLVAETYATDDGYGETLGRLIGHDSTIAFTTVHGKSKRAKAWVLVSRHGRPCPRDSVDGGPGHGPPVCERLRHAGGGVTTSVDRGRILTVARTGLVRALSSNDRVLKSWKLGRGIDNARLRGRELAVQHGGTLDIYDTTSGAKRQALPLALDEGLRPDLLDVQGDLVTYATGGAIHLLRLSSGRDVALDLPGGAPSLDARLERTGLFVSWNKMWNRRPGRLAFIPLQDINSLL